MTSQLPGAAGPEKISSQPGQSKLYCEQCKIQQLDLKRCSKCRAVLYCSKACQIENWKMHKRDCVRRPPANEHITASEGEGTVWGIRLSRGEFSVSKSFIPELLSPNHPIFTLGELCPTTALYGIPLIICSTRMFSTYYSGDNQPAVYLRIEPDDGFAPIHWQIDYPGDCFAIRKDRKPLKKELLEIMYQFHSSLLGTDFFLEKNHESRITSAVFRAFADDFVEKQRSIGRNGFSSHLFDE